MNRFRKARIMAGLTQTELAKKLGVSAVSVHKWECGQALPRVKRMGAVADALNTTVDELLTEERAV